MNLIHWTITADDTTEGKMSNSMEQDKPEMLAAKEKEEEEMKRELLDMKMYESWYTYKEMKQILGFINESKDMANVKMNDEKNAQKELSHTSNEGTSELMLKSNLMQELEIQEDNDVPKLINSHKSNHISPIHGQISSHNHGSPEHAGHVSSNTDSRNYLYKNKALDNDDIFDRLHDNLNMRDTYSHSLNRCVSLKEKNILQDPHSTNNTEIKIDSHSNSQKLEQWQINPLDSCISENDVPLREPERPIVQDRMPFKLCKDAETSESLEKLLIALNIHLKQTAELWHSWHRTADSKFQWGSPIQVGVTKSSLDTKSLTNSRTEENQMECTDRYNSQRPNKRKATLVVSSSNATNSSDEDEKVIKRKKTYEPSNRILRSYNETRVTAGEQSQCLDDENINKNITKTKNLKVEHKERQCLSPELLPSYSRKITPPNIRKYINKKKKHNISLLVSTLSAHDTTEEQNTTNLNFKQKDNILTNEEILLELEKDDTINNIKVSSENTEIKPLPTRGLSHRIKNECMILERIQMEKQKKLLIEKEKAQKKEDEEKRKREEFYKKQLEDKKQKEKQKEEKEKSREDKSKKWKSVINAKSHKKVGEECREKIRGLREQNENETLCQDNMLITKRMDSMKDNISNYVNCPICNKCFPSDKIETHAAGCEQYITDNEDENNANLMQNRIVSLNANSEEILECGVCLKYRTTNDANYEQHINNCLQKQHQEESISGKINADQSQHEILFPAIVPGGIYTDLYTANIIPDNFIGNNDLSNRWVGNRSVTYTKRFNVNKTLLSAPKVMLIFHGLDTFATILINAQEIGRTSNMFIEYTFDVTNYLKKGENLLSVSFDSAVKEAETLYNAQALKYIVPPVCVPNTYNGECHVNHIRKMQASFSWDWGPAFPSMGIWKSVELIPINDIFIKYITTDVLQEENFWNINVTIYLEVTKQQNNSSLSCQISSVLHVNEQTNIDNSSTIILNANNSSIETIISLKVPVELIDKWWPNGYGNQTLYTLTTTAATDNVIKKKSVRIGFRTVELVQKPLKRGLSFYFQINGIPIFAKGSNYIPASIFPELSNKVDTVKHLLKSAKVANMNMLRVWGGGLYESDLFYKLADEYGIMIWQDFMFACGMYPTTEKFLDSVKDEVVQNVQRLKNHPSIVLWAGNNENEAALYGDWYGTGISRIYKTDYIKLYVDLIKQEVEQLDSTRPFVVSSPSNGLHTEKYNYIGENPYSKLYGDVHYYNYFNNGWDMHQYPLTRFASEYGFQSLPSIYTIIPVTETIVDLNINSNFMKHRQHLPLGTLYMRDLILKNFKIPETGNRVKDFSNFIYLSQINQAVSIKIQTEFYRQSMSELNEVGEGMTMGALYWQLNDVWQAPSWSSIDFYGRWKMLHYYAVDFFAPIIVTYYIQETNSPLYIVSDKLYPIINTTLEVNFYTWNTMTPVQSYTFHNLTIKSNAATKIDNNLFKQFLNSTSETNYIITLTLRDKTGSQIAPRNYIYPSNGFKTVTLQPVDISIKINELHIPGVQSKYPTMEFELTTNNTALFVWLEAADICGHFSENGFHMFERRKKIVFHACETITPQTIKEILKITTLSDIYNLKK
nr:beta-mannosidase [Nomia melanderi]